MNKSKLVASAANVALIIAAAPAAAQQPSDDVLEEVVVQGRYITRSAIEGRLGGEVRDVPFSTTEYSEAFIEEIDAGRVADLYRYMTGISRAQRSGFGITIRGFTSVAADRNAMLLDGLPGVVGRSGSPPSVSIEGVEVFRGPSSVLYGRASPGGFVNLISKKPQAERKAVIELQGNSYPGAGLSFDDALGYDASIDFTGPIDSGETVLYRFVSEYNDNDSYRNDSWEKAFYASPSITWKISDRSKLNFGLEYHEEQFASDDFLVAPNLDVSQVADVKTRYQDPDDASDESTKIVNLGFEHAFSDNITFNIRMRSTIFESAELAHSNIAIRPNNQFLSRRENYIVNEREFHFLDANTRFKFNTGPFEHSLLVGVAAGREVADFDRRQFFTGPARPNPLSLDVAIHDPVFPTVDTPTTPDTHRRSEVDVRAIYMSNLMTLSEKWKLMLGARYDREEDQSQELRLVAPTLTKEADAVTPMLGLIFQPNETWSFYGSYSESFRPPSTNSRDVNGVNSFDPETGNQIEVGAKAEFANGRVATTLALFRIDRENGLVTGGPGFQVQTGAERSEGGEFEVSAEPIDNWRMIAGYAYADARIISDSVANRVGAQSTNSPKHSAHLWTRYDFPDGSSLRGFGAGLGVVYVGERVGTTPSATVTDVLELPSYESIDLGLFYTIDTWDFTLKVNNVLDDVFFSSAANQFNVNPGNPRSLSLRVIKTF